MTSPTPGLEGIFYQPSTELSPEQAAGARVLGKAAMQDFEQAQQGGVVGISAADAARATIAAIHAGTIGEQQPQPLSSAPGTENLVSFKQADVLPPAPATTIPPVIGEGVGPRDLPPMPGQ